MQILLIDDHTLYRDGISMMLEGLLEETEIFEAGSYEAATLIMENHRDIDIVLLDLDLPGTNFIDALLAIRQQLTDAMIVIVSGTEDPAIIEQSLRHGARGYLPKSLPSKQMINALQMIIAGDTYMPASILNDKKRNSVNVASNATRTDNTTERNSTSWQQDNKTASKHELTSRQYDVLMQLAKGKSNKAIGRTLFITESTVRVHVAAILKSFGVSNRTQAVRHAIQQGWISIMGK